MSELDRLGRNRWIEGGIIKVVCPVFSDSTGRLYAYHTGMLLDDPETGYTHPWVSEDHPHPHLVYRMVAVPEGYLESLVQKLEKEGGE